MSEIEHAILSKRYSLLMRAGKHKEAASILKRLQRGILTELRRRK